jgi:hypothetical protein
VTAVAAAAVLASLRGASARPLVLEAIGALYLGLLYWAIRLTARRDLLRRVGGWLVSAAGIAAALGLAGTALDLAGLHTSLVLQPAATFPYFGPAPRAQALTPTPNMLASILGLALIMLAGDILDSGTRRRKHTAPLAVLLLCTLALTISKTVVCTAAGALVAVVLARPAVESRRVRLATVLACVLLAAMYTAGSLVIVAPERIRPQMEIARLIGGEPILRFDWRNERYIVLHTNYWYNQRASLQAVSASWPWGLGPGAHNAFVQRLLDAGDHPGSFWLADPHSTYLGTAAELGAAGVIALAVIWTTAALVATRLLRRPAAPRGVTAALAGACAAIAIEATATDVMNFRHYWWLLAMLAAWDVESRPEREA